MTKTGVLDTGVCNLNSWKYAVSRAGSDFTVISRGSDPIDITHLIIPGVGSFGAAMQRIQDRHLDDFLGDFALSGRSIMGVCLGMHLLLEVSAESIGVPGLSMLPGQVRKLQDDRPRIGWDQIRSPSEHTHVDDKYHMFEGDFFFFNHNYFTHVAEQPHTRFVAAGNASIAAMIVSANITGVQFHPERSQNSGVRFLKAWLAHDA